MIIAMDPGNEKTAVCMWDGSRPVLLETLPNEQILEEKLPLWILDTQVLVIEEIVYGVNVGIEICRTIFWYGRFYQEWTRMGGTAVLVPRATVKAHLCGKSTTNDGNVWFALKERFAGGKKVTSASILHGLSKNERQHERQALALAVTYRDREIGPENPFA